MEDINVRLAEAGPLLRLTGQAKPPVAGPDRHGLPRPGLLAAS